MATSSSGITALYEDVVASLLPHYDNFVLLPNPAVLTNSYNISGGVGDTLKLPITNYWSTGASVGEGNSVIGASADDFAPGFIQVQVGKRGAGTYVTEESLEDGGLATVRNAVITRLSRAIAQGTDVAGFATLATGSSTAPTDIANVNLNKIYAGGNVANIANADVSFVMSPECMSYVIKREPTVKMFNDIDKDQYEMVATVRNGFGRIPYSKSSGNVFFAQALIGSDQLNEADENLRLSLDNVSEGVARLRADNAPTGADGFFVAVVSAAHEFHLAKELNGIGGTASGAIGSVAQMAANQALIDGLIGQAVGARFIRSQNVPTGLTSA
jgi:hypothetical protein